MTDFSGLSGVERILAHAAELKHAGVKGMRWGYRKQPGGGVKKTGRTKGHPDAERAATIKRKRLNEMSNDELKEVNKRMQLETQFRQLNPSIITRGQNIINRTLGIADTVEKAEKFVRSEQGRRVLATVRTAARK